MLMANRATDSVAEAFIVALTKGLRALDWREGGNLRLDWRWTGGDPALFDRYAAELVAWSPDVLLAQYGGIKLFLNLGGGFNQGLAHLLGGKGRESRLLLPEQARYLGQVGASRLEAEVPPFTLRVIGMLQH